MAKKRDIRKEPPVWCKDAVPSVRGWLHPVTGEILVAIKLDMTQFDKKSDKAVEDKTSSKEIVEEKETTRPKRQYNRRKTKQ